MEADLLYVGQYRYTLLVAGPDLIDENALGDTEDSFDDVAVFDHSTSRPLGQPSASLPLQPWSPWCTPEASAPSAQRPGVNPSQLEPLQWYPPRPVLPLAPGSFSYHSETPQWQPYHSWAAQQPYYQYGYYQQGGSYLGYQYQTPTTQLGQGSDQHGRYQARSQANETSGANQESLQGFDGPWYAVTGGAVSRAVVIPNSSARPETSGISHEDDGETESGSEPETKPKSTRPFSLDGPAEDGHQDLSGKGKERVTTTQQVPLAQKDPSVYCSPTPRLLDQTLLYLEKIDDSWNRDCMFPYKSEIHTGETKMLVLRTRPRTHEGFRFLGNMASRPIRRYSFCCGVTAGWVRITEVEKKNWGIGEFHSCLSRFKRKEKKTCRWKEGMKADSRLSHRRRTVHPRHNWRKTSGRRRACGSRGVNSRSHCSGPLVGSSGCVCGEHSAWRPNTAFGSKRLPRAVSAWHLSISEPRRARAAFRAPRKYSRGSRENTGASPSDERGTTQKQRQQ